MKNTMDTCLRIMMIGPYKHVSGGVAQVIVNQTRTLVADHNVLVVTSEKNEHAASYEVSKDGGIMVHKKKIWYTKKMSTLQELLSMSWLAHRLRAGIDVFHAHGVFFAGIGFIHKKIPFVLTVHGYFSQEAISRGVLQEKSLVRKAIDWFERKAMTRADAIVAVDKRIYTWIIDTCGIDKNKVFHLPNAADADRFSPHCDGTSVRAQLKGEHKKIILFLKAFEPKNGPAVIVEALPAILREHPDTLLVMAGSGALEHALKQLVQQLNIEKNILFTGNLDPDTVPAYMAASDIVVVPSIPVNGVEEATSLTMLEGMASGKPVVASDIGGLKETIGGHTDIGVLAKAGDHADLASKINILLHDKKNATHIGNTAREFIVKNATWKINAKKLVDVYHFAIRTSTSKRGLQ